MTEMEHMAKENVDVFRTIDGTVALRLTSIEFDNDPEDREEQHPPRGYEVTTVVLMPWDDALRLATRLILQVLRRRPRWPHH